MRSGGGGHGLSLPGTTSLTSPTTSVIQRRIGGWDRRQATLWDDDQIARM